MSELFTACSTISDGNMSIMWESDNDAAAVYQRRCDWLEKQGIPPERTVCMAPEHKTNLVCWPDVFAEGLLPLEQRSTMDFILIDQPDAFVLVPLADCLGVAFWARERSLLIVAHVGAAQVDRGSVPAVLRTVEQQYGIDPTEWEVKFSPCIADSAYRWDEAVYGRFPGFLKSYIEKTAAYPARPYHVNWRQGFRDQLEQYGLVSSRIGKIGASTYGNPAYFSHAESAVLGKKPNGRHAFVAGFR